MTDSNRFSIGVDIGGTHILAILMNMNDSVIVTRKCIQLEATERSSIKLIVDKIATGVVQCLLLQSQGVGAAVDVNASTEIASRMGSKAALILGVGLSVPGNVDPLNGLARYLPNFGWNSPVQLRQLLADCLLRRRDEILSHESVRGSIWSSAINDLLSSRLYDSIEMRNDGRCAAIAESYFGYGSCFPEHCSVMALLTLGTGIGGAMVYKSKSNSKGQLFDGCSFDAGDFGHHVICSGSDAFECVCGKAGCFEAHASAAGLVRHYNRHIQKYSTLTVDSSTLCHNQLPLDDAKVVVNRMKDGDRCAMAAFSSYLEDLSAGLANLVTFYNPSVIILAGGLSQCPELLLPQSCRVGVNPAGVPAQSLVEMVDAKTLPATRGMCRIVKGELNGDAGAMGAASLFLLAT